MNDATPAAQAHAGPEGQEDLREILQAIVWTSFTVAEKAVLFCIAAQPDGLEVPSHWISLMTGLSKPTFQRAAKVLKDEGVITIERKVNARGHQPSMHRINLEALRAEIVSPPPKPPEPAPVPREPDRDLRPVIDAISWREISQTEKKILHAILNHGWEFRRPAPEMAKEAGVTMSTWRKRIQTLVEKGLLQHPKGTAVYRLDPEALEALLADEGK